MPVAGLDDVDFILFALVDENVDENWDGGDLVDLVDDDSADYEDVNKKLIEEMDVKGKLLNLIHINKDREIVSIKVSCLSTLCGSPPSPTTRSRRHLAHPSPPSI